MLLPMEKKRGAMKERKKPSGDLWKVIHIEFKVRSG